MGGSKTTTVNNGSSTTTQSIPAEIRQRGSTITNAAMNNYFDPASKYTPFSDTGSNAAVGQATTGQLNGLNGAGGVGQQQAVKAGDYQPYYDAAGQVASGTQTSGPNYSTGAINQFQNPWNQDVINTGVRNIGTALGQQQMQNEDAAAKAGAFGGARHGVIDAMAQRTAAQTLGDFMSGNLQAGFNNAQNQYNTNFTQGLQANQQNQSLAQLLGNLGTGQTQNAVAASNSAENAGNIQTAQDQAQKTNAYNYGYLDQRNYPMDIYEQLASINAMQPINRTSTTNSTGSSTQSGSGGWLGPALGAAGNIAGAFAVSDVRAKEDIEDVDPEETLGAFSKIRPKSYRYKDSVLDSHPDLTGPGERTGFMAQDAERAFKRPVGPEIDGIKTVDVSKMLGEVVVAIHGLEKRTRYLRARPKA